MRIVALDFGQKRVGVAVGDTELGLAFPVGVLPLEIDPILRWIREQGAQRVIVGMPYHLSGARSVRMAEVEAFIEQLEAQLDLPVERFDERLTTREAERRLIEADYSRRKRKQVRDALAAALLLEVYLRRSG